MAVTASELRANIYRMLDEVLDTGVPLEIARNGRILRVTAVEEPGRLSRVVPIPDLVTGDPGDLADLDMSVLWDPDGGLAEDDGGSASAIAS